MVAGGGTLVDHELQRGIRGDDLFRPDVFFAEDAHENLLFSGLVTAVIVGQVNAAVGRLRCIRLDDGETLDRDALFFYVGWQLRTEVASTLGCELRDDGSIAVDTSQATSIDRVYAAGNCADARALVPAAAGAGVTAAVTINARLSFEDADRAVADTEVRADAREDR